MGLLAVLEEKNWVPMHRPGVKIPASLDAAPDPDPDPDADDGTAGRRMSVRLRKLEDAMIW
jgi:hypothetical protein